MYVNLGSTNVLTFKVYSGLSTEFEFTNFVLAATIFDSQYVYYGGELS